MSVDTLPGIWDHYYEIRIPAIHAASEYELQVKHAMGSTGNRLLDEQIKTEWRYLHRTISDMVDLFKKGIPIVLVNYKDSEAIYCSIQAHIEAMAQAVKNQINIRKIPYEDLIAMDEFAHTVYNYAGSLVEDSFRRNAITGLFDIGQTNMFANDLFKGEDEEVPERNSMSDYFKEMAVQSGMLNRKKP